MHTKNKKTVSISDDFIRAVCELGTSSFREASGLLKHPYVHPGGPYGNNQWDWDSYWVLTALADRANIDEKLFTEVKRYGCGVMQNFFDHQGEDGSISILMTPEDTDWFDSTSMSESNPAKPVLGQTVQLLWSIGVDITQCSKWLICLDRYYQCLQDRMATGSGLYAWVNDAAIGADDDPTAWGRPPHSAGSLFLNCFLYKDLISASDVAKECGQNERSDRWLAKAKQIKEAILKECWRERDGFFYSVDVQSKQRLIPHRHFGQLNINLDPPWRSIPLYVRYWTGFLPLWAGLASKAQAERVIQDHLMDKTAFWSEHGVRTLAADEPMYDPLTARGNPSNWLGPVWVISNYLVWEGLKTYGFTSEANHLRAVTISLLQEDWKKNQMLHENYHPDTGVGIAAPGFISWNVLVLNMIHSLHEHEG